MKAHINPVYPIESRELKSSPSGPIVTKHISDFSPEQQAAWDSLTGYKKPQTWETTAPQRRAHRPGSKTPGWEKKGGEGA